jgi:SAM-dependent methyltransferase
MIDSDDREAMRAYIEAADRYFRDLEDPQALFSKPYVPLRESPYNAVRLGYLLAHLRHNPLHTVVDFGAGMCWLTIGLRRTGCRVVALDVSKAALELGERAFREARLPASPPRFLVYDGYRFPLEDGSVDRIACYDALHHVPNKTTVLREMHRVLRPGGRACFVEPGPGHSASSDAVHDTEQWGVLEDEIDATRLCEIAAEVGFSDAYTVPLPDPNDNRLEPLEFRRLRVGERRGVLDWTGNDALIVLIKDGAQINSRSPQQLRATVEILDSESTALPGQVVTSRLRVTNTGDTHWLALPARTSRAALDYDAAFLDKTIAAGYVNDAPVARYRAYVEGNELQGMVTVGARLWDLKGQTPIDLDYGRGFLPHDLAPGETAEVAVRLRAPQAPDRYCVTFDLVDEYLTWFISEGSPVAHDYLTVVGDAVPPDSRDPHRLHATIELLDQPQPGILDLSLTNSGDTVWLKGPLRAGGFVQLGAQRLDDSGAIVDRDWLRFPLKHPVRPGESIRMRVDTASRNTEAVPAVRLDLVCELRCWFSEHGSQALTVRIGTGN